MTEVVWIFKVQRRWALGHDHQGWCISVASSSLHGSYSVSYRSRPWITICEYTFLSSFLLFWKELLGSKVPLVPWTSSVYFLRSPHLHDWFISVVQDKLWITYTSLQMLLLSDAYSRLILFGLFTFDGFYIMPQVVDSLLDIVKTPRKPQYTMAPELPLILRSCLFDKVSFMCSSGMSLRNFACGDTFREHFQPS